MGLVYLVEKIGQTPPLSYAMKVLNPGGQADSKILQKRFLREAEIARNVQHPGIVAMIEYGIAPEQNVPYPVMEYVDGESLENIIAGNRPLTVREKTTIIRQLADALAAIHAQDLCHRDIKPGNVLVTDQLVAKLTDFGLVRVPNSDLTCAYKVVGTPAYLAPESYLHATVDHRVDLFALGVTAYELYFGKRPFDSIIFSTLVSQIENELPLAPRSHDPTFPFALEHILARLLKKDPAERYQRAADVVADFDAFLQGGAGILQNIRHYLRHLRSSDWR